MTRLMTVLLGVLSLALLAACGPTSEIGAPGAAHIDVDTPALRALRDKAGIEPCAPSSEDAVKGGLPDVVLPCLGGGEDVSLAGLRGPLVITFWASWCGPCRRELPIYQRFAEKYAGRVGVLGIDTNDVHPDAALELAQKSGVTFPLVADTETAVAGAGLRVVYMPTIAFLDAEGRLTVWSDDNGGTAVTKAMEITSLKQLEDLAAQHLGEDALGPVAPAKSTVKSAAKATAKKAS
ncbi:TlpA disulfide reductase family protein [Nocardioides cavernaquae]|uniref:TlpA family protein disulfide reductase n=1 Tax=Nocardioides cavernaquae TaxID=2321396 RepID=A0A3A5HDB3_9ACTN|nr:TlpA disulfide reductase family protein [Nocardioides cavernaquae]RJS46030.1 TlpA family protein disulfide reductase [Nocardioides cavernaquae]